MTPLFCQLSEKVGATLILTGESGAETIADNNVIPRTKCPEHILFDEVSHYL